MNFGKYPLLYLKPNLNRNKRELLGHLKIPCITSTMLFYNSSVIRVTLIKAWFVEGSICESWKVKRRRWKAYRAICQESFTSVTFDDHTLPSRPTASQYWEFRSLSDLQYPTGIHITSFLSKATSVLQWTLSPESSPHLFSPNAWYSPLGLSWDIIPEPLG